MEATACGTPVAVPRVVHPWKSVAGQKMIFRLMVFAVLCGMAACSSDTGENSEMPPDSGFEEQDGGRTALPDRLCEPADEPSGKLVIGFMGRPPQDRIFAGDQVLYDHGAQSFFVDDTCHFWAFDTSRKHGKWSSRLTGTIQPNRLSEAFQEMEWESWSNRRYGDTQHGDGGMLYARDRYYAAACVECDEFEEFKPLLAARAFLAELLAKGQELEPPSELWYLAELIDEESLAAYQNIPTNILPQGFDPVIGTYFDLFNSSYGSAHKIEDPAVINELWALRTSYLAKSETEWWYAYIPFTDSEGRLIQMKFRRSLPELENENGLVPPFIESLSL